MEYPIIEGKASGRDFSYEYVTNHSELEYLEKGIPYREFYFHSQIRDKKTEYRLLKKITETQRHGNMLALGEALNGLNRYRSILPYTDTAVQLNTSEYINASLVDGTCTNSAGMFIATQGPTESTFEHFWTMVWESEVSLIVMLCNFIESDHRKCDEYFAVEGVKVAGNFHITTEQTTEVYPSLTRRVFTVKNLSLNDEKVLTHLHALNWPDQGAPNLQEEFNSINYLISEIKRNTYIDMKVLVHCSAGIGRTGILIGIYNIITALEDLIRLGNEEKIRVSVFGTVRRLREQRWGMVNSYKQYKFLYKFVECWLAVYFNHQTNHAN